MTANIGVIIFFLLATLAKPFWAYGFNVQRIIYKILIDIVKNK